MSEAFDAYHKWLGIPPAEQPPNHYRLLGVALYETDADVIEGAADRQMAHVQTHKTGKYSALSQKILNELSAAKLSLLDKNKKSAYDAALRKKLADAVLPPSAVPPPVAPSKPPAVPPSVSAPPIKAPPPIKSPPPVLVPAPSAAFQPGAESTPASAGAVGTAVVSGPSEEEAHPESLAVDPEAVGRRVGARLGARNRGKKKSAAPIIVGGVAVLIVLLIVVVVVVSSRMNNPPANNGNTVVQKGNSGVNNISSGTNANGTSSTNANGGTSTIKPKQPRVNGSTNNNGNSSATNGNNTGNHTGNGGHDTSTTGDPVRPMPGSNPLPPPPQVSNLGVTTNSIGMKVAKLPAGSFRQKSPRNTVQIPAPLLIGVTEVTQAQYKQVMGAKPSAFCSTGAESQKVQGETTDDFPVENVTAMEAVEFCIKLSEMEGLKPSYRIQGQRAITVVGADGYRLPNSWEWQYAACPGGEEYWQLESAAWDEWAWHLDNSQDHPHPVAQKKANAFGLYDTFGNVGELLGPLGSYMGHSFDSLPAGIRSATMNRLDDRERSPKVGFRVVRATTSSSTPSASPPPMVTEVAGPDKRIPIPDSATLDAARKQVKELFKDDYRKAATASTPLALAKARFDLAEKLFKEARRTSDDPPSLYVLLEESAKWSGEAGVPIAALEAASKRGELFQVRSPLTLKVEAVSLAAKNVESAAAAKAAMESALPLVDDALATGDVDGANKLVQAATLASGRWPNNKEVADLAKKLPPLRNHVRLVERFRDSAEKAKQTLKDSHDDTAAHATLGLYLLLIQDDLDEALPHFLAAGGALEPIAKLEDPRPASASKKVELADKWHELALKDSHPLVKNGGLQRAKKLYQQALPQLSGLTKTRVDKTLREIEDVLSQLIPGTASS